MGGDGAGMTPCSTQPHQSLLFNIIVINLSCGHMIDAASDPMEAFIVTVVSASYRTAGA
jgi:hypothetical protein